MVKQKGRKDVEYGNKYFTGQSRRCGEDRFALDGDVREV